MKEDVRRAIGSCKNCQRNKLVRRKTRQPMLIADTPKKPFEKIQINLVGPLPVTSKGNTHILTIKCVFSKYCDAIPIKNTDSVTIATAIAEEFITCYGCPCVIQADQGSNLVSKVIKIFCNIFRIQKIQSTAYHPQSLGSLKRSHHTLIKYLRSFGGQVDWYDWTRFAAFSYNVNVHEAKEKYKKYHGRKANPKYFKVGNQVYLEINEREDKKCSPYYTGPYVLEKLIGERNALIRLGPIKTKIFHLDKLRLNAYPCIED